MGFKDIIESLKTQVQDLKRKNKKFTEQKNDLINEKKRLTKKLPAATGELVMASEEEIINRIRLLEVRLDRFKLAKEKYDKKVENLKARGVYSRKNNKEVYLEFKKSVDDTNKELNKLRKDLYAIQNQVQGYNPDNPVINVNENFVVGERADGDIRDNIPEARRWTRVRGESLDQIKQRFMELLTQRVDRSGSSIDILDLRRLLREILSRIPDENSDNFSYDVQTYLYQNAEPDLVRQFFGDVVDDEEQRGSGRSVRKLKGYRINI